MTIIFSSRLCTYIDDGVYVYGFMNAGLVRITILLCLYTRTEMAAVEGDILIQLTDMVSSMSTSNGKAATGSLSTKLETFEGDDVVVMTEMKTHEILTRVDVDPGGSEITMPKLTKIRTSQKRKSLCQLMRPTSLRFSSSALWTQKWFRASTAESVLHILTYLARNILMSRLFSNHLGEI